MKHDGWMRIKELLQSNEWGKKVTVKGWVRTKRGNNTIAFIALNDGSVIHNIQIVTDVQKFDQKMLNEITTGSCICVKGTLVESVGKGQKVEIQANEIKVTQEA